MTTEIEPAKRPRIFSPKGPLEQRFWYHVDKSGPNGCWIWRGPRCHWNYGKTKDNGRIRSAHRISWEMANGREIPKGMFVCHTCDNPPCVNPDHLWIGTPKDNTEDMVRKGRHLRGKVNGERNPHAALTDEAVRDIRTSTLKTCELAAKHGVSQTTIYTVKARRSWAHVPDAAALSKKGEAECE